MFDFFPVDIVTASLADVEELAELHATAFSPAWSTSEIESLLSQDEVLTMVVKRANVLGTRRAIGFVMLRLAADEAEVLTLVISHAHRGKGLARRLVEAALRRLYFERISAVFLEVNETNEAARKLYDRLKFIEVGRRKGYYAAPDGSRQTALVLRRNLD